MKKFTLCILTVLILMVLPANEILSQVTPGWQWAKSSGGTDRDEAELPAVDKYGNVTICGKFSDTAWFGTTSFLISSGNLDLFVARYDASGNFLWARKAGTTQNAEGLSIASGPGGVVAVTGYFRGSLNFGTVTLPGTTSNDNFFIALYDSAGTLLWADQGVGGHIKGKGVEFDPNGDVLVTGHYEDSATFGSFTIYSAGYQNAFLVKYSATGTCLWASYGGGIYNAWASSVGVDSQGNSYITGAFKDTASFGVHTIITYGLNDVFLAKCSPAGNWIWARHAGGTNDDYGNGIEVDVYGHIAVTGSFFDTVFFSPAPQIVTHGAKDGFVAYYNPGGDCLWVNGFGGTGEDKGIGVSTDNIGNVYVTGFIKYLGIFGPIQKPSVGIDDVCLAKYTRTGQILWVDLAGGTANDYGKGIQVYKQGVAYVAGYYEGTASFGNTVITSKGNRETYVAKYRDGTPEIITQPQSQDLCIGDSLILTVIAQGSGYTYTWFRDTVMLQGMNSNTIALLCNDTLPTGKYTCVVSTISGYAVSDTAHIKVWPYPVVGLSADTVKAGNLSQIIITANTGHASYQWSTGDVTHAISYLGTDLVQLIGWEGYIYVTVTNQGGCQSVDSVWVVIVLSSVDEPGSSEVDITLVPNPVKDFLKIICSEQILRAEIVAVNGQILLFAEPAGNNKDVIISTENIPSGIYIVKIKTGKGIVTRKLIKD